MAITANNPDIFPTLPKESYTTEGEPIYGGSIGMNRVYDRLVKTASSEEAHAFRVIVINAMTVIRNNYADTYKEMQLRSQQDLTTLITYLSIYLRKTTEDRRKVSIILLYPTYDKLPREVLKAPTAQLTRILNYYNQSIKSVKPGLDLYMSNDVLQIFTYRAGDRFVYPHQQLKKLLVSQVNLEKQNKAAIPFRMNEPVHLLSHVALDWHLSEYFSDSYLIESYTGGITDFKHIGAKLVKHKELKIPFNTVIHRTFGDSTFICPLAVRAKRKSLLESAKGWSMMTTDRITSVISKTLDIPVSKLTQYKFS